MMWPMRVQCYGRCYEVYSERQMWELTKWLEHGEKALANRYRVGASWPRGSRPRLRVEGHGERMTEQKDDRQTVAMCDVCGRGFMWVAYPEKQGPCIDKSCRGRVLMLVTPENNLDDRRYDRERRLSRMREGGYVQPIPDATKAAHAS